MILFSASYHRGTPSADLRAYQVCDHLRANRVEAEIIGPADGVSYCRERILSLGPSDTLYIQKWSGQLHNVNDLSRCRARIVYDFDDLTSSAKHRELIKRSDAFVVGAKSLASQVHGSPVLVAPTPIEPELFGNPVPYAAREPGVVVAKYGMKPYLGKLADLAPMLVPLLKRYGYNMWFLGAHRPAEHQRLKELYPGCRVYPLVKMGRFYDVQVPIIKAARWGFVPYDRRCKGKSATSVLTLMACGVPVQAFAFGNCEEMFGRRLRRWVVRDNERFIENAERLMSDLVHGERFLKVCRERVLDNSLDVYCERLLAFFEELD